MKKLVLAAVFLLVMSRLAFCEYVQGYYRKDGSYVGGYYRSDRDSSKLNNYGSKGKNDSDYSSPYSRDYDSDGTPNYLDYDDDNDGTTDNDE